MSTDDHPNEPGTPPGDRRPTGDPGPFTDFGQFGHGYIDKRVLDQDIYWVDITGRPHFLVDMSDEYLRNVQSFLFDQAEEWWLVEVVCLAFEDAVRQVIAPETPVRPLDAERGVRNGPMNWIASTPLVQQIARLLAERETG